MWWTDYDDNIFKVGRIRLYDDRISIYDHENEYMAQIDITTKEKAKIVYSAIVTYLKKENSYIPLKEILRDYGIKG